MKLTLYTPLLSALILPFITGCESSATEEEKAAFSRNVLNQENREQKEAFEQAIEPGYQADGVGQVPAWEEPVN